VGIVSVIDTATNTVVTTTQVGTDPGPVVVNARNVYVVNKGSQTVSVIDI
jgi:DNA-binding beta-propeller fold protein YncE